LGAIAYAAVQAGIVTTLAAEAHTAWDVVMSPPPGGLILIDNLDSILAAMSHEHRDAFVQAVQALLREGSARGIHVALATLDHGAVFAQLQPLLRTRLELSGAGLATWQGLATRVALAPAAGVATPEVASMQWEPFASYIVVTHRPQYFARRVPAEAAPRIVLLRPGLAPSAEPTLYVGDVDDWQSAFALLAALKATAHIVFDGCTPSEVRALRLFRGLLPHTEAALAVHVTPEGEAYRARLGDARAMNVQSEREEAA
jgi:S-DNA-T family DNA segregation ATPase FtsK/SpoIIIE